MTKTMLRMATENGFVHAQLIPNTGCVAVDVVVVFIRSVFKKNPYAIPIIRAISLPMLVHIFLF